MSDMASLLEGIDPHRVVQLERSIRRARRLVVIESALTFALLVGAGTWALWHGWQTGDWFAFWWPPIFALLELIVVGPPFANVLPTLRRDGEVAQALRRAAASGDDRLAPIATGQPNALRDDPLDIALGRAVRLRSFSGARRLRSVQTLYLVPLFYLTVLGPILLFSSGFVGDPFLSIYDSSWFYAALVALFPIALVIGLWRTRRLDIMATADEIGVTWNMRGAQHRIAWSQVRSFFVVHFTPGGSSLSRAAYVLDGGEEVLPWSESVLMRSKMRAERERFRRIIAARDGKPLRDLSSLASSLAISSGRPVRLRALGVPTETLGLPEDGAIPSRWRWRPSRNGLALTIVALMLLVALTGTGIWLQACQPEYRAGLPAQLHAERPLYADALSANDGTWHPAAGAFGGHGQFTFANGMYQLSDSLGAKLGEMTSICAWAPGTYGDAAVEVTASQSGSTGEDGVGLVVRADASGDR